MEDGARAWIEARLAELRAGGPRTPTELRTLLMQKIREAGRIIRVDVRGTRLAFAEMVDRGGELQLEQFELDAGSPGATRSQAREEIAGRKQAEQALIDGLVDALELRHGMTQAKAQLRGAGGSDGPGELLYDLIGIGAQTLRELLHLNARANRRLLAALRSLGPAAGSGEAVVVTPAGTTNALLVLDAGGATSELTLESRRRGALTVDLPAEVSVCRPDGTGAQTLQIGCTPARVTLGRGEKRTVVVCLVKHVKVDMSKGTLFGEMVLGTDDGGLARVAVGVAATAGQATKQEEAR